MAAQRSPDAVERLYVYSLLVAVLLVLLIVLLAFVARGQFVQQQQAINELTQRLDALEAGRSHGPATRPAATRPGTARPSGDAPTAATRPTGRPSPPASAAATSPSARPAAPERPSVSSSGALSLTPEPREEPSRPPPATRAAAANEPNANVAAVQGEAEATRALASVLREEHGEWSLIDPEAAARALRGLRPLRNERLPGEVLARLAILARLLEEPDADAFVRSAMEAETGGATYFDFYIRDRLRNNAIEPALKAAEQFADASDDSPLALLLLGEVLLAQGNVGLAAEVLPGPDAAKSLALVQRLRLGRAYVQVARYELLPPLLAALEQVPAVLGGQRDFLQAVALLEPPDPAQPPDAARALPLLDRAAGEDCLVQAWRGVALMRSHRADDARAAFDALTGVANTCPAAWYWRGVLEASTGRPDDAVAAFEAALALAPAYAAAWEARGAVALNRGEVTAALESLSRAAELEPRRASTQFLIGLSHAKAGREEPAGAALRTCFRLDERYVERARQADLIRKLFDDRELAALLEAPADEPAETDERPATMPAETAPAQP